MIPVHKEFLNDVSFRGYDGNCSHEPCMAYCAWFHFSFVFIGKAEFRGDFWEAFSWTFPFYMRNCVLSIIRRILRISPQARISWWKLFILPLALILLAILDNLHFHILKILHIHLIVIYLHVLCVHLVLDLLLVFAHLF